MDKKLGILFLKRKFISTIFSRLPEEFHKNHNDYYNWLSEKIELTFQEPSIKNIMSEIGIDWVTIHYRTRHICEDWAQHGEWIQVGIPIVQELKTHFKELQVYKNHISPYISIFNNDKTISESINIYFAKNSNIKKRKKWTIIQKALINELRKYCIDEFDTGPLNKQQIATCIKEDSESVELIRKSFSVLTNEGDLSINKALGYLRDSSRVTLYGLNKKILNYPRAIILVPIFIDSNNLIGGAAFLAPRIVSNNDLKILISFIDSLLTDIRLYEEGLREEKISHLEELNAMRSEFVSIITHSLQTPIENLKIKISELANEVKTTNSNNNYFINTIKEMKKSIIQFSNTTDQMMQAFTSDGIEDFTNLKLVKLELHKFFKTILFRNQFKAEQKQIKINISNIPKSWCLYADKRYFSEAIMNMIDNAIKYSRSMVEIIIERTSAQRPFYIIHIIDDGTGIDKKIIDKLFQPGLRGRLNGAESTKIHGFGLYLSKKILQYHNGTIRLQQTSINGTEFVVEIPESFKRRKE